MRLTLDALYVLDAIDRKGSFAQAAEALHRVPSAITYTIRKLEADLGVSLFDRRGRRAVLTDAGRELLEQGRGLLQAAGDLEERVRRVATGWEPQLRIAVDHLIRIERVYPLLQRFYHVAPGTHVRLAREVYGGTWDALFSGRADLALGATGEGPPGGSYISRQIGQIEMVFAVAPDHPLCSAPQPLAMDTVLKYRAISVPDTSQLLAPRTAGLVPGQEVLSVPDMTAKLAAHRQGLGVGYLPRPVAEREAAAGRLVICDVEGPRLTALQFAAWRRDPGKGLKWLADELARPETLEELLGEATA